MFIATSITAIANTMALILLVIVAIMAVVVLMAYAGIKQVQVMSVGYFEAAKKYTGEWTLYKLTPEVVGLTSGVTAELIVPNEKSIEVFFSADHDQYKTLLNSQGKRISLSTQLRQAHELPNHYHLHACHFLKLELLPAA